MSGLIYKSLLFYTVDSGETWRLDKNLLPWGHPIISFDWATDKIVYEAGFDLSIFKYTQQNLAPIAEAGPDRTAPPNVVIMLDGSASYDPDGDTLTYAWKQTGGPPVQLNGADQAQPTFTATQAERYIFELTVTDSYPESASDTVTITVTKTGGDDDTVTDDDAAPDDDATGDDDAAAGDDDATNHGGDDSSGDNGGCGC